MNALQFIEFVEFMGMVELKTILLEDGTAIILFIGEEEDRKIEDLENNKVFTSRGYDEFEAGLLFVRATGEIIKSYIDSHVTHHSVNRDYIRDMVSNHLKKK